MQKNNKITVLEDFCNLVDLHKETTEKAIKYVTKTFEYLQEVERLNKEIRTKLNSTFGAPTKLNTLEKIIYYFNRKHGVTLEKIAEITGYNTDYILQISARINRKLRHNPPKAE